MIKFWIFWLLIIAIGVFAARKNAKIAYKKDKKLKDKKLQQQIIAINNYHFNENVLNTFRKNYPQLDDIAIQQVVDQLKNYFIIVLTASHENKQKELAKPILGMPSRVVDDLWHIFILDSRVYMTFCMEVLEFYLHHNPPDASIVYRRKQPVNDQLYTTWAYACQLEGKKSLPMVDDMPMLFQIDDVLNIAQGFSYDLKDFLAKARHQTTVANSNSSGSNSAGYFSNNNAKANRSEEDDDFRGDDATSADSCSSCGGGGD